MTQSLDLLMRSPLVPHWPEADLMNSRKTSFCSLFHPVIQWQMALFSSSSCNQQALHVLNLTFHAFDQINGSTTASEEVVQKDVRGGMKTRNE